MLPTVDVIVLSFNRINYLRGCLATLYKNTVYPFNLIIVDNVSVDGSREWLRKQEPKMKNLTVHYSEEPDSGFSAGNNIALDYSKSDYVLLLNSDVLIWQYGWLKTLVSETVVNFVPENQYEIVVACRKAKKLEFKSFFVRPAAYEGVPGLENRSSEFDVEAIRNQLKYCETLENDWFKVYYSFGRVGKTFERVPLFDKCRASPLIGVFCADGYAYLCIDSRGRPEQRLCKHMELFKYWGGKEHLERIENIDLSQCPRCAFGHYQQQLQSYAQDYMFWKFP